MKPDIYQCTDLDGKRVNLNDLSIYPQGWKDMKIHELFYYAWGEAGRSLFHMTYFWPHEKDGSQWFQVQKLCQELVGLGGEKRYEEKDRLELMKWLYRFVDETENQC